MNVKPAFSFSIDMKLSEKGVAVGKYDGTNASLTAITQSNKASNSFSSANLNFFNFLLDYHSQPSSPLQSFQ